MGTQAQGSPEWPGVLRTKELQDEIRSAKVLCVGAGGIGCELLKTLVCSGFRNIEVVDLDTIETSNLNRQFLFRKHHVGQSKATTAAKVVQGFCPAAKITAYHANIKESRFDVDFFRGFDMVLNGLDNLEARRHVNRMCLAADRPLVESGTAGYLGQVMVHLKGRTACFECVPKAARKTFPICTLRNTPDQPIHTIVWAKDLLFNRLFGPPEAISDLDDQARREDAKRPQQGSTADATNGPEGDAAANGTTPESEAEGAAASSGVATVAEDLSFFLRKSGEGALSYAARIFERVYSEDIEQLRGVKELWEKRPPPQALQLGSLLPESEMTRVEGALTAARERRLRSASGALGLNNASKKWTRSENAAVLLLAIAMYHEIRAGAVGSAAFDKDDDLAVDFVTAASNLRSSCYGIPEQSLFDAKGMAGNIIHAIATTNAIISGLIVTEATKILAGCHSALRNTYLHESNQSTSQPNKSAAGKPAIRRQVEGTRLVVPSLPDQPFPCCMVCGKSQLTLRINTKTTTLSAMLSGVVKKRMAVNMPNLLAGDFLYEEGEGLEPDEVAAYSALLPRTLCELPAGGLRHGTLLTVQDQSQHFSVDVVIVHTEDLSDEEAPEGFILEGQLPAAKVEEGAKSEAAKTETAPGRPNAPQVAREDEDGVVLLDDEEEEAEELKAQASEPTPAVTDAEMEDAPEAPSLQRSLDNGVEGAEEQEPAAKRIKVNDGSKAAAVVEDDDDVIIISDADE